MLISLKYSILISIVAISFLFSPAPNPENVYKTEYVVINNHMGFQVNIDADEFVEVAANPKKLLDENEIRQSRPLYIILGSVISYPVSKIMDFIGFKNIDYSSKLRGKGQNKKIKNVNKIPVYIGYVILNGIFLLISLILFNSLLTHAGVRQSTTFLFSLVLLYNLPVKEHFWTAHTQMLNILMPVYAIYLLLKIANYKSIISTRAIISISLSNGFLLLLYGNFLVLLPVIMLGILLNTKFNNKLSLANLPMVFLAFIAPSLLWILYLNMFTSGYYQHEMQVNRTFIWIFDYIKLGVGPLVNQMMFNAWAFFKTLDVVLIFLAIIFIFRFYKSSVFKGEYLTLKLSSFIVFLIIFIFLISMGFYVDRLSFTLVVPLVLIVALGVEENNNPKIKLLFIFLILLWSIYQVTSYGPYV
jgi:hypothetical protein